MAIFDISFALGFGCGGAVIWFFKDWILARVMDANTLSAKLHAKADAITAAAKKL